MSGTTQLKAHLESTPKKSKSTPTKYSSNLEKILESSSTSVKGIEDVKSTNLPNKKAESLARLGRAYGNNISKLNVFKQTPRHQSAQELREPWVSSSKTESRVYGDYYSWQAGLSYLEGQRTKIILSKGMKHFMDGYMRKLQRCQIFERGHNVEPFATARLQLINKNNVAKSSKTNVLQDSRDSFGSNWARKNPKNTLVSDKSVTVAALKTIELIRKYKNGESIEGDLRVADKNVATLGNNKRSSGQEVSKSGTTSDKNRSSSTQNQQKILTKKIRNPNESNLSVDSVKSSGQKINNSSPTKNISSSTQSHKILTEQNRNSNEGNISVDSGKSNGHTISKSSPTRSRSSSMQNQTILTKKNGNPNESNISAGTVNSSGHKIGNSNPKRSRSSSIQSQTILKEQNGNPYESNVVVDSPKETVQQLNNLEEKASYIPPVYDIGQNFMKNLEDQREVLSMKSNSSKNRSSFLSKYLNQSEKAANIFDSSSVESLHSAENIGVHNLSISRRNSK